MPTQPEVQAVVQPVQTHPQGKPSSCPRSFNSELLFAGYSAGAAPYMATQPPDSMQPPYAGAASYVQPPFTSQQPPYTLQQPYAAQPSYAPQAMQRPYHMHGHAAPPNIEPHGFPMQFAPMGLVPYTYPYSTGTRSPRKRYATLDPMDEAEASFANITITYPLIDEWLRDIVNDPVRGRDNINYLAYSQSLSDNGILRLDDLTRLGREELCKITGMNIGTAGRLIHWAGRDQEKLDGGSRNAQRQRQY